MGRWRVPRLKLQRVKKLRADRKLDFQLKSAPPKGPPPPPPPPPSSGSASAMAAKSTMATAK